MSYAGEPEKYRLLSDIVFWGERLALHLANLTEEQFSLDAMRRDAACWCISCIGEAAGRLRLQSPELLAAQPELELAKAYAMRNRIAHGYFTLDIGLIWTAATVSVPNLVNAARARLNAN